MPTNLPEPWLRGPLPGVPALLQPAAHAFVMAREDVTLALTDLTGEQLWLEPGGAASLGFHVAHLAGSTDRLLTYARGEALSPAQREQLAGERTLSERRPPLPALLEAWHATVAAAIQQLSSTPDDELLRPRPVGRAQLPSTVLGLLFHAAEHASRHTGQIVTTAKMIKGAMRRTVDFSVEADTIGTAMIDLYNTATNALIGSITEADLQVLVDGLEEESSQDQDYYLTAPTIELLGDGRASDHLIGLLRQALGASEGVEIRWQRR